MKVNVNDSMAMRLDISRLSEPAKWGTSSDNNESAAAEYKIEEVCVYGMMQKKWVDGKLQSSKEGVKRVIKGDRVCFTGLVDAISPG